CPWARAASWIWLAKDNHCRTGRDPLPVFPRPPPSPYLGCHMTHPAPAKPASLYPTRSAAGALLGQQLATRGHIGCLLLGITPDGVEIAASDRSEEHTSELQSR